MRSHGSRGTEKDLEKLREVAAMVNAVLGMQTAYAAAGCAEECRLQELADFFSLQLLAAQHLHLLSD